MRFAVRAGRALLCDEVERLGHLRVVAVAHVVRGDVDVVVGIGSVVLHGPADVDEPEREFRLGRDRAVDQAMVGVDADDAAPGPLPDQRAEAVEFEAVAEDVAVGARELVGERDHRAADGLGRIGHRRAPARDVVADAFARQFLEQERRDVAAAIIPHVDDQRVAIELGEIPAMELREAPGTHVGNVQVADAAVGALVDVLAIALDPSAIAQHALVAQRAHDDPARFLLAADDRQLHFAIGGVDQHLIGRVGLRERAPADRDDRVAFAHVEARLGQGRVDLPIPRVAAIDLGDRVAARAFIPRVIRAEEAAFVLRRAAVVAADLIGVRRP